MPRNILQDIVPPEKRSIRNITLPERERRVRRAPAEKRDIKTKTEIQSEVPKEERDPGAPKFYSYPQSGEKKRKPKKMILWITGGIFVLIMFFIVSSFFESAVIKVTPRNTVVLASNEIFTADAGASEGINLEVLKLSKDGGEIVPATGEERVERKASGQIIIYNNFDSNSQRLIRNTRFQTPEGLVYRIDESVVIPGKTSVPGSVEVTVYADEPGERYNIGLKDFTIPGFSDDPGRFREIYARSKTEMTGGFVGTVKKVSSTDELGARDKIREKLQSDLKREAVGQVPEGFVLFDDAIIFDFESLPQSQARGDSVQINERVTLNALIIRKSELANALADRLEPSFVGEDSDLVSWNSLSFEMQDKDRLNLDRDNEISFVINGEVNLMKKFDQERLKSSLVGKSKKSLHSVLSSYPAIERAQSFVKPFWKRSYPDKERKIKVEIVL